MTEEPYTPIPEEYHASGGYQVDYRIIVQVLYNQAINKTSN
jgi:hypothetical protein